MKRFSYQPYAVATFSLMLVFVLQGSLDRVVAQTPGIEKALQDFYRRQDRSWTVRLSDDRKRVTSLFGRGSKAYRGQPAEMASTFLRENHRIFGLNPGLKDLRPVTARASRFGSNVEFQQTLRGLPVENARVQINFDKDGHVLQVFSSYAPLGPLSGLLLPPKVTKKQATDTAKNEFLRTTSHHPSKVEQQKQKMPGLIFGRAELELNEAPKIDEVYFARRDRLRRAYRILIKAAKPFGIKEFVTDARSGEILQTKNFVYNAVDGEGQVFIPNPVNSQNNPLRLFLDAGDENTFIIDHNPNPYFTVPLLDLDGPAAGLFTLRGPFVVLENIESPNNTPPSIAAANNFNYRRSADEFEEVMLYYHIDRMQRYILTLGFCDVNNRQIRVDAHGVSGANNSHYVTAPENLGQGYLAFGDGGVDDAEDADVIAHEYAHAIQDNQAPGKYAVEGEDRQTKAIAEGFADYWAVSSYAKETRFSGHEMGCVMEWDNAPGGCLRRVSENVSATTFVEGASDYVNGRIWSVTLFDIFTLLGKNTADRLILQSHFNVPVGPSFRQAAEAIETADQQLFSGSHIRLLRCIFASRNIYEASMCPSAPSSTDD